MLLDLQLCPSCFPCVFGVLGVPSHCLQCRLLGAHVCCEEISAASGAVQNVYPVPHAPPQCFSLEEDDLNLTSLEAETILEAEEILGTMQNYLDSSVISIIEDLSLSEVGAHTQMWGVAARLALAVAWLGVVAVSSMSRSYGCIPLPSETVPTLAAEQGLPGCTERAVPADCHHRDPGQHR